MPKQYTANGLAGCVEQRTNRLTGFKVGVYQAAQAGMESDPATPWATVCEEHNSICVHGTLALARSHAGDPPGWCEDCRKGYLWDLVTARYVRLMADHAREAHDASEAQCALFGTPGVRPGWATLIERDDMPKLLERLGELTARREFLEFRTATADDIEQAESALRVKREA
jgi:hypothetical protein